ncbi:MAG: TnpV protein [Blautia sp.]
MIDKQPSEIPGKYGMLRKTYLKKHRGGTYQTLLLNGKLTEHLLEIDRTANTRIELITNQLLQSNPVPDKTTNPMSWIAHMNSLHQMAEEIVLTELVYN